MSEEKTNKSHLIPPRKGFTAHQRHAAQNLGTISSKDHNSRRRTITHPIDDVHPNIVSDRDDGIFVEANTQGEGYRVHITIADVAGYIPLDSPLSDVAHDRAFTVYRPWMIDHMFPSALMERMSLEHEQERLGLSVIIDLDEQFQPIHTELEAVITESSAADYDMATEYMKSTPEFAHMRDIAQGVKTHFFGESNPDSLRFDNGARTPHKDLDVKKMIETYMLLANYAVANIFSQTELPFMYRNFDGSYMNGMPEVERAYYGTECTKHTALPYLGALQESYCHFTSPIRRGPDYYNGHMVHHAIEVMQEAEDGIREIFPNIDQPKLHHALWQQAPEILNQTRTAVGERHVQKSDELVRIFKDILREMGETPISHKKDALTILGASIAAIKPPIDKETLAAYAAQINPLNDVESDIASTMEVKNAFALSEKRDMWERNLEGLTADSLVAKDKDALSMLLKQAAATGKLPECLYDEAIARIVAGQTNDAEDALTIMLEAPYPYDEDWNKLKKRIAKSIKHHPTVVNNIFDMAEARGLLPIGISDVTTVMLPVLDDKGELSEDNNFSASYLALPATEESPALACPYYSVGQDKRASASHARYSFLEHYAFGQLKPLSEVSIPNILYAELDQANEDKEHIVRTMLRKNGGDLSISMRETQDGEHIAVVKAQGDILPTKMVTYAAAATQEEAKNTALKRLLRNTSFKHAMSLLNPLDMHQTHNPLKELQDYAEEHGLRFEHIHEEISKKSNSPLHQTTLTLTDEDGTKHTFTQRAPNQDRALYAACVQALYKLQIVSEEPSTSEKSSSWVDDATKHRKNTSGQ